MKKPGWILGNQGNNSKGFTIVETMIVLAITGFMFAAFVVTINDRQAPVKFRQSINAFQVQMNDLINQSQTGTYSSSQLACNPVTGRAIPGTNEQGSNNGCVILGKVVQFDNSGDPQQYHVYPISGLADKDDFGASNPSVIDALRDDVPLQQGLEVAWMRVGGGGSDVGAVAFIPSFKTVSGVAYGSTTTQVLPVNTNRPSNANQISTALQDSFTSIGPNPSQGVEICLRSGTSNQSGLITIGGRAGSNKVSLSIRGNNNCA